MQDETNYFLWHLTFMNWSQAQKSFSLHFWLVLGILAPSTSILAPDIAKRMIFIREFSAMLISRDCMLSYHWFHLSNYCDVIFWVFSKFATFNYFLIFFIFSRFQFRWRIFDRLSSAISDLLSIIISLGIFWIFCPKISRGF